ncbi:B12-binding domain-containing radical SAM protein [Fulvivirga sp. 29W222]|uniref:B12-binding domain-containing radical SAM protein n=1 Tax=Fulvivirga marina TaxID=2494733 RepID=A0A937G3U2_9BACT|nr:radical SAM protein [Fulvivirga marina]MBL6449796.1 B12-binding domain-containing radical SAM protein [Fulvivirga marina]
MKKVLFTHSFFYKLDYKQWKFKQPYPPLGTIFAASLLRENNYAVSLFDTNLKDTPHELLEVLEREVPEYLVIYDDGFNYLTKMCLTNMREAAFEMIKIAKGFGCTIIVSSSDSSDHYQQYLDHGTDYVLIGEAEITLQKLLNELQKPSPQTEDINGIAFKNDNRTHLTGTRPVLRDLDTLPIPAWDLINIDEYRQIWMENHGYFSLNIATTRGCPYKCNWCAKPIYGNRYNTRSPQKVVEEMELLMTKHKPDHFWVCDDIFGLKPGWIQDFRDILKRRNLKVKYKIQSRVDLLLQEDTIEALAESGLETVWVGAESGSQKILDAMDKGTKVQQIGEATRLLQQKGVKVAFFLQFGYLGETREDIQKTKDMVLNLMPDEIGISVSYPLPGTKFYNKVKQHLQGKANWSDSDDLDTMFSSNQDREFYKKLPRYIHKVYRKKRGILKLKELARHPFRLKWKNLRPILATLYYVPSILLDKFKLRKYDSFPG